MDKYFSQINYIKIIKNKKIKETIHQKVQKVVSHFRIDYDFVAIAAERILK